jgi:DnaA family protein
LNASAEFARREGVVLQIYDAVQLLDCEAAEFEGYGDCDVLAIDNLDAVAGNRAWEAFFYRAINRCRDGDYRVVFSLGKKPGAIAFDLEDLRSRLQWGLMLQLPQHGDDEIREILSRRAALLGFELGSDVISYLMSRYSRDLCAQMEILRLLDGASLSAQRRITIPLVRQALGERDDAFSDATAKPAGARSR